MSWHVRISSIGRTVYWVPPGTPTYDPLYDGHIPHPFYLLSVISPNTEISFNPDVWQGGHTTQENFPTLQTQTAGQRLTFSVSTNMQMDIPPNAYIYKTGSDPIPMGRGGKHDPTDPNGPGCQR